MASLINKARVRQIALELAKKERPAWGPTRVSHNFLAVVEAQVRIFVAERVRQHPSKGKTLT